jgi:hypothetical protein
MSLGRIRGGVCQIGRILIDGGVEDKQGRVTTRPCRIVAVLAISSDA